VFSAFPEHRDAPRARGDLGEQLHPLLDQFRTRRIGHPRDVAAGPSQALGETRADRISGDRDDRDRPGQLRDGAGHAGAKRVDQVRPLGDRRRGEFRQPPFAAVRVAVIDDEVAAFLVPKFAQTGLKSLERLPVAARRPEPKIDDTRQPLLRTRRGRAGNRRAADAR